MAKHFIAPGAYVQGPGVLEEAVEPLAGLRGRTAYLLGGRTALSVAREPLAASLDEAGFEVVAADDDVEQCTRDTVADYAGRVDEHGADVVVGGGGGVAIGAAVAAAAETGTEFVSVPTIASTDAPCSALGVIYDEEGNVLGPAHRDRNPEIVLVDTRVIARAPARFTPPRDGRRLRHPLRGRGGGPIERDDRRRRSVERRRSRPGAGGVRPARGYGPDALAAARRDAVTPALERIVETNVLLDWGSRAAAPPVLTPYRAGSPTPASGSPTASSSGSAPSPNWSCRTATPPNSTRRSRSTSTAGSTSRSRNWASTTDRSSRPGGSRAIGGWRTSPAP
jgi:glycerol dehydrogenase